LGITREELKVIIQTLKSVYTNKDFIPDQFAFDTWCLLLQNYTKEEIQAAALTHMRTNTFAPKPADIIELIGKINHSNDNVLTETEVIAIVRKACSNSAYNSEEEFNKLPETIKKVVGSPRNLKEWSQLEKQDFEKVTMSIIARNYTGELKRQSELEKIPQEIREKIEQTTNKMIGG